VSLQRRLLVYLLVCAPLVWVAALLVSADRAREEVNELFDTELIRLSRQMQATLSGLQRLELGRPPGVPGVPGAGPSFENAPMPTGTPPAGEADLTDLAIAVWDKEGQLLLVDREGVELPHLPQAAGFVDMPLNGEAWRLYYLQAPDGQWLVAAGQHMRERDELVQGLVASQLLPWLLVLPVLLLAMAWAVRQALAPLHAVTDDLQRRSADDLQPLQAERAPRELQPLLAAMNNLFTRIDAALVRERRFTADAAHELRTPLAVLRAQWDVQRHAVSEAERQEAGARLGAGLDRLDRLVSQMLALARVDALQQPAEAAGVAWPLVVETVMSDVLPLAERRHIELACDWPAVGTAPFPLQGDASLLGVLLRNLMDNAVRYAPEGSTVTLRFGAHGLAVANDGPALDPQAAARLGERFHRQDGQVEGGSGLGVSIAQRVATLHGLRLHYRHGADGQGVVVELERPEPAADTAPGQAQTS
jgi:two-component system, OmpR family, sensor histidine kinase QseC